MWMLGENDAELYNTKIDLERIKDKGICGSLILDEKRRDKVGNIKDLRKRAGMTQKVFAEYFGIPKRTIEDWEGNRRQCAEYLLDLMEYKLINEKII